ncbi:MAG: phosphoribosyltransferase, partial [Halobacteriota archaeon]|nr:phosphoribosyltransferase [Halobacteriota archaeon]
MGRPDKYKFIMLDWERVYNLCKWISRGVKVEGFKPDTIVAIARGGWFTGLILSDLLSIKDLRSIKIEHWGYTGELTGEARITQEVVGELNGKNVLLVDDITDTGDSMRLAMKHLGELNAKSVRTAVLKHKTTSTFKPDYIGTEMDDWKWVVFPWNVNEDIMNIIEKVLSNGMPIDGIEYKLRGEFDLCIDMDELHEIMNDMELSGR